MKLNLCVSGWKAVFSQRTQQVLVFWTAEVQETGNDEGRVSALRLVIASYLFHSVICSVTQDGRNISQQEEEIQPQWFNFRHEPICKQGCLMMSGMEEGFNIGGIHKIGSLDFCFEFRTL